MSLWQKNTSAYLFVGSPADQSQCQFFAVTPGTAGNSITVASVASGNNTALSVSVSSSAITIHLATDGSGNPTSTVALVETAITNSGPASALVTTATGLVGGDGSGLFPVFTTKSLAGGLDQSAPNWVDSWPAADGWRSSKSGELLVSQESGDTPVIPAGAPTISNSYIWGSEDSRQHYNFGTVADSILFAVEWNQAVNVAVTAAEAAAHTFGSSNSAITFTAAVPGTSGNSYTVVLIAAGASTPLSATWDGTNVTVNLATNGGSSAISTVAQVIALFSSDLIPFDLKAAILVTTSGDGTGVVGAASVQSLASGAAAIVPTIPITIGSNTRALSYLGPVSFDQLNGYATLLFGYPVVSGDAATVGNVQIGTGIADATHAFGSGTSEVTFNSTALGAVGNSIRVGLNAPISSNVAALTSTLSNGGLTITYNLKTHNGVKATHAFGTSNAQILFTAVTIGAGGNAISVELLQSGSQSLSVSVVGNVISVHLASSGGVGTSLVSDVVTYINTDGNVGTIAARALITPSFGVGDGSGTIIAASVQNLTGGVDASSNTLVSELVTFVATDPHSTGLVNTTGTSGGAGAVAGIAATLLSGGVDATASINLNSGSTIKKHTNNSTNATLTFVPNSTALISVN